MEQEYQNVARNLFIRPLFNPHTHSTHIALNMDSEDPDRDYREAQTSMRHITMGGDFTVASSAHEHLEKFTLDLPKGVFLQHSF